MFKRIVHWSVGTAPSCLTATKAVLWAIALEFVVLRILH